jgi:hypothetical protein
VAAFDRDRTSSAVADRIRRDVDSGLALVVAVTVSGGGLFPAIRGPG